MAPKAKAPLPPSSVTYVLDVDHVETVRTHEGTPTSRHELTVRLSPP